MPIWYHVSNNRFSKFSPKYNSKFGTKGIFLSPTFYSIVHDWANVVASRKDGYTRKGIYADPFTNKKFPCHFPNYYKTLYVYHVWVRPDVARKLKKYYNEMKDVAYEYAVKNNSVSQFISSWCWGDEVFVPHEYLDSKYIKIVKCEKVKTHDLYNRVPARQLIDRENKTRS